VESRKWRGGGGERGGLYMMGVTSPEAFSMRLIWETFCIRTHIGRMRVCLSSEGSGTAQTHGF
jgi:hypothetical protein